MNELAEVRIDKWLWATRLYQTRSQAIEACQAGHVKIGGLSVKPARSVRVGEVIALQIGELSRSVKVAGLLAQRVGAKMVGQYLEDLTPAAEYEKYREKKAAEARTWIQGAARPTKKQRRTLVKHGYIT